MDIRADPTATAGAPTHPLAPRWAGVATALVFALLAWVWTANSSGLISSNDGSHLALARALVLRAEPTIDPDRALTLEVDVAERGGHAYSDRPPGTAFAALPAVWIGDRLDPGAFERAVAEAKAGRELELLPGAMPYIHTYAARVAGGSKGPNLAKLIATSVAISIHAVLIGLLGLLLLDRLLRRLPAVDARARLLTLATIGLATAWGPYATTLFAHGSAATAVTGFLLGLVQLGSGPDRDSRGWPVAVTGLAGAWAVACDYLLLLAIVPATLLTVPWRARTWAWLAVGAAPIVLATAAYHTAAFGGPLAIGYDHQRNFEFARERGTTFSGGLFDGLWTLWGLGRGAGLLAQAPIVLAGLAGLAALAAGRRRARAEDREPVTTLGRALLGFLPWIVALALHRTPWGGGTNDHRYLIPLLPLAGVGLALAWAWPATRSKLVRLGLRGGWLVLAGCSAWLVWRHFLAWHEAEAFARSGLGAWVAGLILMIGVVAALRGRAPRSSQNLRAAPESW